MDEYYRVPLTSGEALAVLAVVRALDSLIDAGLIDSEIEPGILASAADRMGEEVPDFLVGKAEALSGTLAQALMDLLVPSAADAADEWDREEPPFPIRRTRRLLRDAYERGIAVEIEYFVQSRKEWTTRTVSISDVHERNGTWYVSGHDDLRDDFRRFRLDHIRSVRLLDEDADHDPFLEE